MQIKKSLTKYGTLLNTYKQNILGPFDENKFVDVEF